MIRADPVAALLRGAPSPWIRRPSPMLAPIGVRGSSDANGSWKMICMRRRNGFSSPAARAS